MNLKYIFLSLCFVYIGCLYSQDRRCSFYDLSKKPKETRKSTSDILIFYSSNDNIGNRLPVLGIAKLLDTPIPDTWCVHDRNIDFNFINEHYTCVIVTGGLLAKCFEPFWKQLLQCTIPIILWGQGGLFPDKDGADQGMNKDLIKKIAHKLSLVNIRDDITRLHYNFENAYIAHCPTIIYLKEFEAQRSKNPKYTVFITHNQNVTHSETEAAIGVIKQYRKNVIVIDNVQTKEFGLDDILFNYYCNAELIISSKLHAGIMAYSLGIPYIMFARDEKQRAFQKEHLNGVCVETIHQLEDMLKNVNTIKVTEPIKTEPIRAFAAIAKAFIQNLGCTL